MKSIILLKGEVLATKDQQTTINENDKELRLEFKKIFKIVVNT